MQSQNRTIIFSRKWYNFGIRGVIIYFGISLIISIILSSPWLFFLAFILPVALILYIIGAGDRWVNTLKNQQFPENLDIHQRDHDAFIIIHSMGSFSVGSYCGLDILIPFYTKNRYPFKIYHCYNPQEFLDVLRNEKAKYIWIIGHGWRGGITFKWMRSFWEGILKKPKKTQFPYAKIRDNLNEIPKKLFIVQFHCNHIEKAFSDNESLVELLLDDQAVSDAYITENLTHVISIWFASRDLIRKIKRTSIPESEIPKEIESEGSCNCR
jgi:hypothetical protein